MRMTPSTKRAARAIAGPRPRRTELRMSARKLLAVGVLAALCGALAIAAPLALAADTPPKTQPVGHAAVSWPTVRPGARAERVRVVQYLLKARSFRVTVDGVYGKSTTAAVKAFQRKVGVPADGRVRPATWRKLVVTIKRGSRGPAVRAIQHQIRHQYGSKKVPFDGVFGASTQAAVKAFQGKRGLRVNGIVRSATWRHIEAGSSGPQFVGDFAVGLSVRVTAPTGTRVTFERTTNGNCAKEVENHDYTTDTSPWLVIEKHVFVGTTGGSCQFELSSQQWLVTAYYPHGPTRYRLVNVEEVQGSSVFSRHVRTVCAIGDLPCTGGEDSGKGTRYPPLIIYGL